MAQHHSDTAAAVAFQSDIARAQARRTADMPLHSQVAAQDPRSDAASSEQGIPKEQVQ